MPDKATQDARDKSDCDAICRNILNYLARHPFTKFNRMALIGIFKPEETRRIDQALKKLISLELVAYQSNGSLYWLTPEEPIHSMLCARLGHAAPAMPESMLQANRQDAALV